MEFIRPSWDNIEEMCNKLVDRCISYKPDWIIGISRGGLVPARLLSDILDISQVSIIRIEFYKTIAETSGFPKITQPLQVDVKGKKVLLVDDVADTGRSLAVAKDHVKRAGAAEVKIASLHYKPKSLIKPDFYVEETEKWIIYPWEKHETERELEKKR